ncbi:MAG: hypothetical protein F4139_12275 [Gemmatimonadetes bacterium]|nr:hypothetical protein [Gemmatimonadota bacterium]MYA65480.1 hypothetical protein [Gemmatimonadota bacterium]MYB97140.1 hypothetical protein [Gemmatimonadota bacterium]MYH53696.1 hypothetical protein [Gemmatimonadota bacterium]MYI47195.1 hypothetical protein [Gemmatimonadota bacterium]
MRPATALVALFLAALASCDDPVEAPSLAGEWTGTTRDGTDRWTFDFESARNPGDPGGTMMLSFPIGETYLGKFSGTYDHPDVTLDISVTLDEDSQGLAEYFGTVNVQMTAIEGTLVIEERTYTLNLTRLP